MHPENHSKRSRSQLNSLRCVRARLCLDRQQKRCVYSCRPSYELCKSLCNLNTHTTHNDVTRMVWVLFVNANRNKQIDHHLLFGKTTFPNSRSSSNRWSKNTFHWTSNSKFRIDDFTVEVRVKNVYFFLFSFGILQLATVRLSKPPTERMDKKKEREKKLSGNGNHILESFRCSFSAAFKTTIF